MADLCYTIHGQQLDIFQNENAEYYINIAEINGAGFALFRKDSFACTLKDDQVDDLTLHLLSEAKNYILKNKVTCIDEEIILGTIEKCKWKLTENQPTSSRVVHYSPESSGISVTTPNTRAFKNYHENNRKFSSKPNSEHHHSKNIGRNSFPNNNFKVGNMENQDVRRSLNLNQDPRNAQTTYKGNKNFQNFSGNNFKHGAGEKQGFQKHTNSQKCQKPTNFKSGEKQNTEFSKPATFSRDLSSDKRGNVQRERNQNQQTSKNFTSSSFDARESPNLKPEMTSQNEYTQVKKSSFSNNKKAVTKTLVENEQTKKSNFSNRNLGSLKSEQEENKENSNTLQGASKLEEKTSPESKIELESAQPKLDLEVKVPKPDLEVKLSEPDLEIKLPKPELEVKLPQSNLELGSVHKVQISYIHPDKGNICWVQQQESVEVFNNMMLKILDEESKLPEEQNVHKGQLVLGLYEEIWYRGEVVSLNPTIVNFMDYGNQSEVTAMKQLPNDFKKLPAFAFQVEVQNMDIELEDGMELTIEIKKYNGQVPLVELVGDKPAVELEKADKDKSDESPVEQKLKEEMKNREFFNLPKQLKALANGKKVKLMDFRDGTLFVKTKECMEKSNELHAYIEGLDLTALTLSTVKEGQLVLSNRHGMSGFYRAIIIKKKSDTLVTVRYLDHPGSDDVAVNCLRNIDNYLAECPITLLMFPKTDLFDNLQEKLLEFVNMLIEKQTKATLVVSGESIDLQLKTGELLSEILKSLSKPQPEPIQQENELKEPEKSTVIPGKDGTSGEDERIMYEDMDWIRLEPKEYALFCYYVKDVSELVMVLTGEECESFVERLLYFPMEDTKPYAPQELEMCMAHFQSSGDSGEVWYRVTVVDIEGDEYRVSSVDYGGEVTLNRNKLRKFPKELKDIPILGIPCELADVPSTDKINNRLVELIPPGEIYSVIVKELNNKTLRYKIEIPAVSAELKTLGII